MSKSKILQSVAIMIAGLILGLIADLFFYHYPPGLNVVLYVIVFLGAGVALIELTNQRITPSNALFLFPAIFFAAMLAIVSANYLTLFNVALMAGSLFFVIRYLTEPEFMGGRLDKTILAAIEFTVIGWLEPISVLADVMKWQHERKLKSEYAEHVRSVLRGCLLAFPIIVVFVILLSSADVIFGDLVESMLSWIQVDSFTDFIGQIAFVLIFAWLSIAALKIMIQKPDILSTPQSAQQPQYLSSPPTEGVPVGFVAPAFSASPPARISRPIFRLGMIESGIILGSVNTLFLVFVIIQGAYLFGGKSNINVQGYTYAEYARRGFFELVAVSIFTMLLVLLLDAITAVPEKHRQPKAITPFRLLSVGVIAMTLVILASAFQRMNLYENAYGFTRLRVFTTVFMVWLALLFVVLAVNLFRVYPRLFLYGCVVTTIGFFATLNLLNADAFIASHNISRFHETGKLDAYYLTTLSDDAVPAIAELLDDLDEDSVHRETLLRHLGERLYVLDQKHEDRAFLGYHYGKDRAWNALDDRREVLKDYIQPPTGRYYYDYQYTPQPAPQITGTPESGAE